MRVTRFTHQERAFIRNVNWFSSIRMLEREPHLVSEDFSTRLKAAARSGLPDAKLRPYEAMARLIDNIQESGFTSAARIQLGAGGVLAGEAREARDRYYAAREPQHLLAALSLFAAALECYDDPIRFDQGRTLHGIGTTLLDLYPLHRSAATGIVGTLAFFASIAAVTSLAGGNKVTDIKSWRTVRKASLGARTHIDTLGVVGVTGQAEAFCGSADRVCARLEAAIANRPLSRAAAFGAGFNASSLAIACSRVRLELPSESASESDQWHPMHARLLRAIYSWLDQYGGDVLRIGISRPIEEAREGQPRVARIASLARRRAPEYSADAHLWGDYRKQGEAVREVEATLQAAFDEVNTPHVRDPARAAFMLLVLAIGVCAKERENARACLNTARQLVGAPARDGANDGTRQRTALETQLAEPPTLNALLAAVAAFIDFDATQARRHREIREALPLNELERLAALVKRESQTSHLPEMAANALSGARLVAQLIASFMYAATNDLGLPGADRYKEIRDGLKHREELEDMVEWGFGLASADASLSSLATKFQVAFTDRRPEHTLEEYDELCDALGGAYESGEMIFIDTQSELTFLVNLGVLGLTARRPDTFRWTEQARQLALDTGSVMDAASADINAATLCLDGIDVMFDAWTLDWVAAMTRLRVITAGLGHGLEALRLASIAADWQDPADRYYIANVGYSEARTIIERLLLRLGDESLLAEYLINARGFAFLGNWVNSLTEGARGAVASRPAVAWRGRAWVAQSLAVETDLDLDEIGVTSRVDAADVLTPGDGRPPGQWFGTLVTPTTSAVATIWLRPPRASAGRFGTLPAFPAEESPTNIPATAAALGELLPPTLWAVVEEMSACAERATLFVSMDPRLPPVSMGLWSRGLGEQLVVSDAFDVVYCPWLGPRPATSAWFDRATVGASAAFVVCDPLGDLPGARGAPVSAVEVLGNANGMRCRGATRASVTEMLESAARENGVFVYQGHSQSATVGQPDTACLLLEPQSASRTAVERVHMTDILASLIEAGDRFPRRAAFLSCGSGITGSEHDATGLAMAALAGGADAVISTLGAVAHDTSAGMIVDDAIEVLQAPDPWRTFAAWQRETARDIAKAQRMDSWPLLASLAMFGTPFVLDGASFSADDV